MKKYILMLLLTFIVLLSACNKEIKPTSIIITDEITISIDKEFTIDIMVLPKDAKNKEVNFIIKDEKIATVSKLGVIKGISVGETSLTVSLKANTKVSKTIIIKVELDSWPTDEIKQKYGFYLPKFPDYSSITKSYTGDSLKLVLSGYTNDEASINEYNEMLVSQNFIPYETNDNHSGYYVKNDIDYIIGYHNNTPHNINTIEITITHKSNNVSISWPTDLIKEIFNIDLIAIKGVKEVVIERQEERYLSMDVYLDDLEKNLQEYLDNLVSDNWEEIENDDHTGMFIKGSVSFFYDTGHGHLNSIEIVISFLNSVEDDH